VVIEVGDKFFRLHGEYFFRCEVHPARMTGTLVVE
jgi:plastocyanin